MVKIGLTLLLITLAVSSFALEVDEKLTIRLLKTSSSKKTILINRGIEDGLVVGDHAKFFVTSGVIARGVLVKVSPARSVWAMYRMVDQEELEKGKAMNIKITTPIKLTQDPSKSVKYEPADIGASEDAIVLEDSQVMTKPGEQEKIGDLKLSEVMTKNSIPYSKTWEVIGGVNFSMLGTTADIGGGTSYQGNMSSWNFEVIGVKYFADTKSWLRDISLEFLARKTYLEVTSPEGDVITSDSLEYGVGASWYFLDNFVYTRFIPFLRATFGFGSITESVQVIKTNLNMTAPDTFDGSMQFMSFGGGAKYFTRFNMGLFFLLEYYTRSESYSVENTVSDYTKSTSGPRMLTGLSYRF